MARAGSVEPCSAGRIYPAGFAERATTAGVTGFGISSAGIWFWQPAPHRMFVVGSQGEILKQTSIALPKCPVKGHPAEVDTISLLPSGRLAAAIACPDGVTGGAYLSAGKRFVKSASGALQLIGVDGDQLVFVRRLSTDERVIEMFQKAADPAGFKSTPYIRRRAYKISRYPFRVIL
jgi:hypothetical protein